MRVVVLACLLLAGLVICDDMKSYRGHHVVSVKATTREQMSVLQKLDSQYDLVFLREPSLVQTTDMVVPPEQKSALLNTLREAGITATVVSSDLQADIDGKMRKNTVYELRHHLGQRHFKHTYYRNLSQVNEFIVELADKYPSLVTVKQLNSLTHENRIVHYLEIGTPTNRRGQDRKPVIFIEAMTHAREWLTTASVLCAVDMVLEGFSGPGTTTADVLTEFTWVIIPIVNPDGYHHSWVGDKLWRKNRNPFSGQKCVGVDLNRNYDMEFGKVGTSNDCGRDIYRGPYAFSEPESRNVRDLFLELKERIVAFLAVHSYSQVLLHPWGYSNNTSTNDRPKNILKLRAVGEAMRQALGVNGKDYGFGTVYETIGYAASGGSFDWALWEKDDIYAYTYELRPTSFRDGGFFPEPSNIHPTGQELLASLVVLAQSIANERGTA